MENVKLFLLTILVFSIGYAHAQVTSTFDTDQEGWTARDNNSGPTPSYQAAGGNPGGFIQVTDGVAGSATYFVAPSKFLGDRSSSYGRFLRFDLQVSVTPNSSTAGVQLSGGGLTLVRLLPVLPAVAPQWSSYSFRLDETETWRVGSTTGPIATAAQMQAVLTSLTALWINGEYSTASLDGGGLDNVILESSAPVVGELNIHRGLSPNNDGKNDFFQVDNIHLRADTEVNTVTIYNRWAGKVFEVSNYDNTTRVFKGLNSNGNELPSGTYFYKIEFASGRKTETGYLYLKR